MSPGFCGCRAHHHKPVPVALKVLARPVLRNYSVELPTEWACSSVGEHLVDIEGVTGSIPVVPTIENPGQKPGFLLFSFSENAEFHSLRF